MASLDELLTTLGHGNGSDLHLSAGSPPRMRVDGELVIMDLPPLTPDEVRNLAYSTLTPAQIAHYEAHRELDFSFTVKDVGRFRANLFCQRGAVCAAFRLIPFEVWPLKRLNLNTELIERICAEPQGLVLVTGATGSGKTTTLAAMVGHINQTQNAHVVTVEDPIEFVHKHGRCLVNQREVGRDTESFSNALRAALREDPDVIMVGEMRDLESIQTALTLAETGHLILATLHTRDCVSTITRIIDVFPAHQQQQIRTQLSFTLTAVISQVLVPRRTGRGRTMACEVLVANPAVRGLIRENKAHQIYSIIQTSAEEGMQTLNQSLAALVRRNEITYDAAAAATGNLEDLDSTIRGQGEAHSRRRAPDAPARVKTPFSREEGVADRQVAPARLA
jgi:twitching motility protein PilT